MIRQARLEDLDGIHRLEAECFENAWNRRMIEGELRGANRVDLVAVDDGRIIGYVLSMRIVDEVHVNKIGVESGWRRRGVANELMKVVEAIAAKANCERITLEVRESNSAAQAFYRARGFYVDHVRPRYYANREDAVFMSRSVGGNEIEN
ncbi:MAG: ribosomal protein S18-alanine N-acetyltransferase [Thermoanaerobaculia bacterium]|nr:ribosomal protein S18-alanine N-acetyltransferase [Thermoanaerobaculia bacterium]